MKIITTLRIGSQELFLETMTNKQTKMETFNAGLLETCLIFIYFIFMTYV